MEQHMMFTLCNSDEPRKSAVSLRDKPELIPMAAKWFHNIWNVPEQAYLDSMKEALDADPAVPAWYVILNGKGHIIAGLGVIENDFHKRPDLRPNICALYVEKPYRKQGLARTLLNTALHRLEEHGIKVAYLITSHTDFYERCGWKFYGMVEEDDGQMTRMYSSRNV